MAGEFFGTLQFAEELPSRVRDELEQFAGKVQAHLNDITLTKGGSATFVQPQCRYYVQNGASQTFADAFTGAVVWSAASNEVPDEDYLATQYDNGERFGAKFLQSDGVVLVPPIPGRYLVVAGVAFEANGTGLRRMVIGQRVSSGLYTIVAIANQTAVTGELTYLQASAIVVIAEPTMAAPGIQIQTYQNSGGDLDVWPGPSETYVQMIKVS